MRFGLFYEMEVKPGAYTEEALYDALLRQVVRAEELGFYVVWLPEHHYNVEYSHISAPDIALMKIAEHTTSIRLGPAIAILPIQHPIMVAERYATLDLLSGGRLEMGVGRGAYSRWLDVFVPGKFASLDDTREAVVEAIEIIRKAWTEEGFTHEGQYYRIEEPINVIPKPLQKPHPRFHVPCTGTDSIDRYPRLGINAMTHTQFKPLAKIEAEVPRFRISFTEPYLLGRPVQLSTALYLFQRGRESYDEQRVGFTFSLGRRFQSGWLDGWAIEGAMRVEAVDIGNVFPLASRQIRDIRGKHTLTSLKGSIVRDTTDSRILPSEGYRVSFSWEQVGALGGDFSFGKPTLSAAWYKTIRTDIFDRKSVLAVRGDIGIIAGDAPPFERFYSGGFGSIRGFSFRGISPRAGVFKNPVGGDFVILTGAEYSFPLYAKTLRGVTFLDMGTVEEGFEITDWRASVGFGFRLNINFFGPVPLVFDFGFPIAQHDDDDIRVFNFSLGASF